MLDPHDSLTVDSHTYVIKPFSSMTDEIHSDMEDVVLHTPRTRTENDEPIRIIDNLQRRTHDSFIVYENVPTKSDIIHKEKHWCCRVVSVSNIRFPMSMFIILTIILLGLSVSAILIHNKYGSLECMIDYKGVVFNYIKWLYIYAWTNIGLLCTSFWFFIISKSSNIKVENLKLVFLRVGYLFQFSWYVVGAVLYFIEVNNPCNPSDVLYSFGLSLFICQTIVWITIFFQDRRINT